MKRVTKKYNFINSNKFAGLKFLGNFQRRILVSLFFLFFINFALFGYVIPVSSQILSANYASNLKSSESNIHEPLNLKYTFPLLFADEVQHSSLAWDILESEKSAKNYNRDNIIHVQYLIEEGKRKYEIGQFEEAISSWQQAIQSINSKENQYYKPVLLTYISLAYQELGEWENAQRAIASSLSLLQSEEVGGNQQKQILAQILTARGRLELSTGRQEDALRTWQFSTQLYQELEDEVGFLGSLINQALALESLGNYRRACATLLTAANIEESCEIVLKNIELLLIKFDIASQTDSIIRTLGLRNLGNILRLIGYLTESKEVLKTALISGASSQVQVENDTLLSLANTEYALYQQAKERYEQTKLRDDGEQVSISAQQALNRYQEVIERSESVPISQTTHIQAQLRKLALLIDFRQWIQSNSRNVEQGGLQQEIETQVQALLSESLESMPPSRATIYTHLDFAKSLVQISPEWAVTSIQIAQLALHQARELQYERAQSYALGTLGYLYEQTGTTPSDILRDAQQLTEEALGVAQAIQAWDIAYQWQWQIGRLYVKQGKREQAIPYYQAAVETLDQVRKNLVATETDLQFSFRDDVEPVYRELVALLLEENNNSSPSQTKLQQAVRTIDALQLSELENFLRCDLASSISIDEAQVDPGSAVLHTVVLEKQVSVVVKLPESEQLYLHAVPVSKEEVNGKLSALKSELTRPYVSPRSLALGQEVYHWLISPVELELATNNIKTLVFILDGEFRSIPMAALYDGEQYLIERYAVAITPGLKLLQPYPLTHLNLRGLTFGLSETREDFSPHTGFTPLENVEAEVQRIQGTISGEALLNEDFTSSAMRRQINSSSAPIVHLATHGQFSSTPNETFVLAWDERINVNELGEILQSRSISNLNPIELLVLSACETANGDSRAALGLAGIAVQSGARSTIASLWSINDESTANLMGFFYQELTRVDALTSKAEALRQAQVQLLNSPGYQAPLFWAPYVLIGNWL